MGCVRASSLLPAFIPTALVLATPALSVPVRVVSMNPCADAILAEVAAPSQIAGLSHWSRDPAATSMDPAVARRFPSHFGTAEEVLMLRPDLVIAGAHTPAATRAALARLGIPLLTVGVPATVSQSISEVRAIARAVGRPAAGEALVARIGRDLAAAQRPGFGGSAILRTPAGVVPGANTLAGALMDHAGLVNAAPALGLATWDMLSVERLLFDPPDLLLADPAAALHPALRRLKGRMRVAPFPMRLLNCGGPSIGPAAAAMARAGGVLP